MTDRRCPHCGELVPSNSITCPKCFKKIPLEENVPRRSEPESKRDRDGGRGFKGNRKVAVLLNLVLGLFGITGLGQLYLGRRRGAMFLLGGLLLFSAALALTFIVPGISWVIAVPFYILYAVVYLISLADIVLGVAVMKMGLRSEQPLPSQDGEDGGGHLRQMYRPPSSAYHRRVSRTEPVVRLLDEHVLPVGRPPQV